MCEVCDLLKLPQKQLAEKMIENGPHHLYITCPKARRKLPSLNKINPEEKE